MKLLVLKNHLKKIEIKRKIGDFNLKNLIFRIFTPPGIFTPSYGMETKKQERTYNRNTISGQRPYRPPSMNEQHSRTSGGGSRRC